MLQISFEYGYVDLRGIFIIDRYLILIGWFRILEYLRLLYKENGDKITITCMTDVSAGVTIVLLYEKSLGAILCEEGGWDKNSPMSLLFISSVPRFFGGNQDC